MKREIKRLFSELIPKVRYKKSKFWTAIQNTVFLLSLCHKKFVPFISLLLLASFTYSLSTIYSFFWGWLITHCLNSLKE